MGETELYLRDDIKALWQGQDAFAAARAITGTTVRQLEQRQTLAFVAAERRYFIKRHRGLGWGEILKNLLQLRLPVASAHNEYAAIGKLQQLGIRVPTVAAYGRKGILPASLESFLVTDDIGPHVSLEDHCRDWQAQPPAFGHKLQLLLQVADIARTLHNGGVCHRDFYLCHLLMTSREAPLTLIDLHRALLKGVLPARWRIKDVAGLYFSAMDSGLTQRDLLRFVRRYGGSHLRKQVVGNAQFWQAVTERAQRLYRKHQRRQDAPR